MNEKEIINKLLEFYKNTMDDTNEELLVNDVIRSLIQYYSAAGFEVNNVVDLAKVILGYSNDELKNNKKIS